MTNIVKIRMKADKRSHGVILHKGDIVKAVMNGVDCARMLRNQNININPEEFEIIIPDNEYNKLLYTI